MKRYNYEVLLNDAHVPDGIQVGFTSSRADEIMELQRFRDFIDNTSSVKQAILDKDLSLQGRAFFETAEDLDFHSASLAQLNSELAVTDRGVSSLPFPNWHEFTLKNTLRDAVAKNDDRVYWVTGEQTKELYNLARHVDEINWKPGFNITESAPGAATIPTKRIDIAMKNAPSMTFAVREDGVVMSTSGKFDGKKLDEIIGKDVAKKIMEDKGIPRLKMSYDTKEKILTALDEDVLRLDRSPDRVNIIDPRPTDGSLFTILSTGRHLREAMGNLMRISSPDFDKSLSLSGNGLKIGGKWAEHLYDGMIPQFMKKQGGKVGRVKIKIRDEDIRAVTLESTPGQAGFDATKADNSIEVWYSDITPKMRKKVESGQEMFAVTPGISLRDEEE
jgi:hypothetical protein